MGYPLCWFQTHISNELLCNICYQVLEVPVLLEGCQHAFCNGCLDNWLTSNTTCPVDQFGICGIVESQVPLRLLIEDLDIWCPYSFRGCTLYETGMVLKIKDWVEHEEKCEGNPENKMVCGGGCGAIITKYIHRIGSHNCVEYLKSQAEIIWHQASVDFEMINQRLAACYEAIEMRGQGQELNQSPAPSIPVPGPSTPPPRPYNDKVVCTKRSDKISEELFIDILETMSIGNLLINDYMARGGSLSSSFMAAMKSKIRICLPSTLRLDYFQWEMIIHDQEQVAQSQTEAVPNCPAGRMELEFEVDRKYKVQVRLIPSGECACHCH